MADENAAVEGLLNESAVVDTTGQVAEAAPEAEAEMPAVEASAPRAPLKTGTPRDVPRLMTRIFGTPLLIAPEKLDVILAALGPRLGIAAHPLTSEKEADFVGALLGIDSEEGDESATPYETTGDGIAVITVDGTLVYKSSWLGALSGLVSYSDINAALDQAIADPSIKGILLQIDSYGGEVNGCFDLSDAVFAARQKKPICAVAADDSYSAAFALASAASKLYVSRTSGVGSVGVVALHIDQSMADRMDGLKYDYIYSGDHKIDGNPHAPLTSPAREAIQAECDRLRMLFALSVARYRGLSVDDVLSTQAACFHGEGAVNAKFADAVGTPAEALAGLRGMIASLSPAAPAAPGLAVAAELPRVAAEKPEGPQEAKVIDLATVRAQVRGELVAEHGEIFELCRLAGRPEAAAEFICGGVSLADVRVQLQNRRAEVSDARRTTGHIMPDADVSNPQANAAGWDTALAKARGQRSKQ